jgi:hypothetical protein
VTFAGAHESELFHRLCVDPDTHLIYFPLQDIDGHPVLQIMQPKN